MSETTTCGVDLIAAERRRQIEQEGWTPDHDAEHASDDLALAAACYTLPPRSGGRGRGELRPPFMWPWEAEAWKPTPDDRVRELVKAGALIAAEIDRLQARPGGARTVPEDDRYRAGLRDAAQIMAGEFARRGMSEAARIARRCSVGQATS